MSNRCIPIGHTTLRAYNSNDTHIYGVASGNAAHRLMREDVNGNIALRRVTNDLTTDALDIDSVLSCHLLRDGQTMFVQCANIVTDDQYYLYKSVDMGLHFGNNSPAYDNLEPVSRIGKLDAVHASDITILQNRDFCEARNGNLYYGEYNTNLSRTPGGANDWVRIFESIDGGDTWEVIWSLNTNGTRQVSHCHAVIQDEYTDDIYICFGDSPTQSAVVQWDGVATFPTEASPIDLDGVTGFRVFAEQLRYVATTLLFTPDYVILPVDNGDPAAPDERGIWRFPRDFSSYERVMDFAPDGHDLYISLKLPTGEMIVTNLLSNLTTNLVWYFYVSEDDGETWIRTGVANLQEGVGSGSYSPTDFILFNDKIYVGGGKETTRTDIGSLIFKLDGQFSGDEPEIISPVFWVDPSGTDAVNRYHDDKPLATLKYALEGNLGTYGMRVILSAGYHEVSAIDLDYQAATFDGQPEHEIIIEGVQGQTWLRYDTANVGQGVTMQAGDGDVTFRKMRVISLEDNPFTLDDGYNGTLTDNTTKGKINWR